MEFHPHLWKNLLMSWVHLLLMLEIVHTKKERCPSSGNKPFLFPYPKQSTSPRVDKLRPVALTDCFTLIGKRFVTNWVLQYGNIKRISTSHYLVSLLHSLHQGNDKINNIGTVVLTDLSKAFDMIDHNILIEKFIRLGVCRSTFPWLCDFVSNRAQCVSYNQAISEYKIRSGAPPQGTIPLSPIGFQYVINDAAQDLGDKMKCWKYVDDWHLQKIARFLNQVGCRWFLMNLPSGLITSNSAWTFPHVKTSKYASKLTPHLMPSWALQ